MAKSKVKKRDSIPDEYARQLSSNPSDADSERQMNWADKIMDDDREILKALSK